MSDDDKDKTSLMVGVEVPEFLNAMLALVRACGVRSLSLTAMCFLERLSRGSATMTDLAERARVSVSAVSPQLAILHRLGLVERTAPGLGDLREKVWRITDLGIELLTKTCRKKQR